MNPRDSTTKRYARATVPRVPREKSELAGPLRDVVYIFEREGVRGGGFWLLVLDCGHSVARTRNVSKSLSATAQLMFRPLEEKLAPKRCQCHYCGSGLPRQDPWPFIKALGGV